MAIVLLTDFGSRDGYVGVMKGVIAGIAPQTPIIDLSHDIPPQDVQAAGFILWRHYRYFPLGTIFCCVVDPGVGSSRKIWALEADGYRFIAPDNGLLDKVMYEAKLKLLMEVENPAVMLSPISHTFHGRDIFAPTAAHLAAGFLFTQLGPIADFRLPPSPWVDIKDAGVYTAHVIDIDVYGNLILNLRLNHIPSHLHVENIHIGGHLLHGLSNTYTDIADQHLGAIHASHGLLEISIRNGNAAEKTNSVKGTPCKVALSEVS